MFAWQNNWLHAYTIVGLCFPIRKQLITQVAERLEAEPLSMENIADKKKPTSSFFFQWRDSYTTRSLLYRITLLLNYKRLYIFLHWNHFLLKGGYTIKEAMAVLAVEVRHSGSLHNNLRKLMKKLDLQKNLPYILEGLYNLR